MSYCFEEGKAEVGGLRRDDLNSMASGWLVFAGMHGWLVFFLGVSVRGRGADTFIPIDLFNDEEGIMIL